MHQVTNYEGIIKEGTKAEPDPNANATIHVLLMYNAWGTTRRILLSMHAMSVSIAFGGIVY